MIRFILFLSPVVFAQTPCSSGSASGFPCNNIDLQAHLTITDLGGTSSTEGNDIWGWTDSQDGKEYAIVGLTSHTAFVDISTPTSPVYLGKLPTATSNSIWRDMKVYNDHVFIVSEASGHGMQVFDLTRLRNVTAPQNFTSDYHYTGFGSCHNIAINEDTGFAYAVGTKTVSGASNGGGPHIVNIQNPTSPVFVSEFNGEGYTHDAQIVIYNGVDTEHNGKEIMFAANEDSVAIIDFSNKNNPIVLSNFTYTNYDYTHQCWLTEDHKYLILGDETDEQTYFFNTKTIIIDVQDLDNPVLKNNYFGPTAAIDHNGYVLGNEFYLANYRAGLRLLDISDINNGNFTEVGFFDTFPSSNSANFNGAWSVYPYFSSQNIIVSDIEGGLFILKKNATLSENTFEDFEIGVYPNPVSNLLTITSEIPIEKIEVFDLVGKKCFDQSIEKLERVEIDFKNLDSGVYILKINEKSNKKIIKK